jgi:hypothetical protein
MSSRRPWPKGRRRGETLKSRFFRWFKTTHLRPSGSAGSAPAVMCLIERSFSRSSCPVVRRGLHSPHGADASAFERAADGASTRPRNWCAMRASTAWRYGQSMAIARNVTARWIKPSPRITPCASASAWYEASSRKTEGALAVQMACTVGMIFFMSIERKRW